MNGLYVFSFFIFIFTVLPEYTQKVATVLRKYTEAFNQKKLLQLTFTTLSEYLWLLRSACQALAPLENKAILYLAAAVSDFYIPSNEMVNMLFKSISFLEYNVFRYFVIIIYKFVVSP